MNAPPFRALVALLFLATAALASPSAQAEPERRYVSAKRSTPAVKATTTHERDEVPQSDRSEAGRAARCVGKATFCAVYSQPFCNSQPGCAYSFALNLCTGVALKCESATNEAFCGKIKGCKWK